MIFPIDYVGITQPFRKTSPIHWGIDMGWHTITNRAITSAANGIVQFCGTREDGALYVVIYHEQLNSLTKYWHLSKITVTKGQVVKQGQQVGNMGSTGNSTAPHLHFETWTNLPKGYVYWDRNTANQVADRAKYAVDPLSVTYLTSKQTLSPKNTYNILKLEDTKVDDVLEENAKLKLEVASLKAHIVELDKQILSYKDQIINLEITNNGLRQDIANMEQDIMTRINNLLFKGE